MQDVFCCKLLKSSLWKRNERKRKTQNDLAELWCGVDFMDAIADTTGNSEDILTKAE